MNAFQRMNTALMIDESRKIFKVSRQAFVDPDILEAERDADIRQMLALPRP
jgi:p-cumate 2,3-dioxygenase alpha subunit